MEGQISLFDIQPGRFGGYGLLPDDGKHYCTWSIRGEKLPPECPYERRPCGKCDRWKLYGPTPWTPLDDPDRWLWVGKKYVKEMGGVPDGYTPPKWVENTLERP